MEYKLYENSRNDIENVVATVLENRGITDWNTYLFSLDESVVQSYEDLDNIHDAVDMFISHQTDDDVIYIIVDPDVDGYCSAAIMYDYIKKNNESINVNYLMHNRAKSHNINDIKIPEDCTFLIIPDAGTNDVDECRKLSELGVDILILDHHEADTDNKYALIVNNQMSEKYKNKALCGAGIVYRFLQALDDEFWNEYADDYLDLVALANISDVMDLRSFETRYLVNTGLKNITNKCLEAFVEAQDYSINGTVNVHNIQWYITSLLNACIRCGSAEEKELLFRAFLQTDEVFEYKKRATKNNPAMTIEENIYDRAARLSKNIKARQDKRRDKSTSALIELANENYKEEDKVVMVDATGILDTALTGVVAIKIAEHFNKPCILLQKNMSDGGLTYGGSARNVNHSPIASFKDVVNKTDVMNGRGHASAFGIMDLKVENKEIALSEINDLLKSTVFQAFFNVDFEIFPNEMTVSLVYDFCKFDDIICQGIEEPVVAIKHMVVYRDEINVFGKNFDTASFSYNDVKYIKFKCKEDDRLLNFVKNSWDENDSIELDIVGCPSINSYNGVKTAQFVIKDYEVIDEVITEDDDDIW